MSLCDLCDLCVCVCVCVCVRVLKKEVSRNAAISAGSSFGVGETHISIHLSVCVCSCVFLKRKCCKMPCINRDVA